MKLSRLVSYLGTVTVLAAVYLIAAKLGLKLAFVHVSATAVWPPTGIALAAFLVFGYRVGPGIFAGAYLANVTTEGTVATSYRELYPHAFGGDDYPRHLSGLHEEALRTTRNRRAN